MPLILSPLAVAHHLIDARVDQAWRAWTTYRNGDHRPHLPAAIAAAREAGAID